MGGTRVFKKTMVAVASLSALWLIASPCRAVDRPRVLIDRSHEWLFAYDDLSQRMLRPAGFEVVLSDASLGATEPLASFDIVMVQQTRSRFPFSAGEVEALSRYLDAGGNVLLVGSPRTPIAEVVAHFGINLQSCDGRAPVQCADLLRQFGADATLQTRAIRCALSTQGRAEPLIADASGNLLALIARRGAGKLTVFADDAAYWDFCAQRDEALRVPNTSTTVALFRLLLGDRVPAGEGPPVRRVPGEHTVEVGTLTVRYSDPIADSVGPLLEVLPRVEDHVIQANGRRPAGHLAVHVLATGGGGWSGGKEIGIQCGGDLSATIAVIAHEMTHSCEGPLPGILSEGWASLVGMRAAYSLGFPEAAREERRSWQHRWDNAKRENGPLDLAARDIPRNLFGGYEGKMMSLVEHLEDTYGKDFMPRFLELKWAIAGKRQISMQDVLWLFSVTAGEDLSEFYRSIGTTYRPTMDLTPQEIETRLSAYRRKIARQKAERRMVEQYGDLASRFSDADWRGKWSVSHNFYEGRDWVEDGDRPPAGMSHLRIPSSKGRTGFLVLHAAAPDVPCRVTRRVKLPEEPVTLHLEAQRRSDRSVLRLLVNGRPEWSRVLDSNGWFHAAIDLSEFSGETVELVLECDTEGAWVCREVFVDYLILTTDIPPTAEG